MRIISGKYRGKHIHPPRGFRARPTTDFAKESLFNILLNWYDLDEVEGLDLFAGTGSISYEFASRGARQVTAIERDPVHQAFIRKTCAQLGADQVSVIRADVFRFLKKASQHYDIIFADPPFSHPGLKELPDAVFSGDFLSKGGIFILEHPGDYSFNAHPHFLEIRKYGGVNFTFFR